MFPLKMFNEVCDVIYPNLCLACSAPLNKNEKIICIKCQISLPKTDHAEYADNPIAKKFWGKVPVERAMALYHFHKSGRIQHLMHALKYKGRKDVGLRLGNLLGYQIKQFHLFPEIDFITAVPLHKDKEKKRGYNQSAVIGEGLSEVLSIPFNAEILQRNIYTDTQTKKSRLERWENVKSIFEPGDIELIRNKHILIVDDVITTGSTLESCAVSLTNIEGVKVSIAAIAHAEM